MMLRAAALAAVGGCAWAVPFVHTPGYLNETRPDPHSTYEIKLLADAAECEVLGAAWGQRHRLAEKQVYMTSVPEFLNEEDGEDSKEDFVQIFAPTAVSAWAAAAELCYHGLSNATLDAEPVRLEQKRKQAIEIRPLRESGPSSNRIDVVFMGDGYIAEEREKMFADMSRLVEDMWGDVTFASYLPVFNIWALYEESAESGIGVNSQPRDTAYRLFRQGTQLRGIFPGNAQGARDACALAAGCDYPSIIGNDPYYGGLGGEFVIATESMTSGTKVLRHEMGHNFVSVGEEYDGGSVYRGANSAPNAAAAEEKWNNWLTDQSGEPLQAQESYIRLSQYPWHDLADGPVSFTFESDGEQARWLFKFTVSGTPNDGDIVVTLDGEPLDWTGANTLDRTFYTFGDENSGLAAGSHTIEFVMGTPPGPGEPIRQVCSLTLHEYAASFIWDDDYVGAYPTWSIGMQQTVRPGNELCLMRNMSSAAFCAPCIEGMWHQFMMRMSLIDGVDIEYVGEDARVSLLVVPLGQFRDEPIPGIVDRYTVSYTRDGAAQPQFDNLFVFDVGANLAGEWTAEMVYETSEVRYDPNNLLTFTYDFTIGGTH